MLEAIDHAVAAHGGSLTDATDQIMLTRERHQRARRDAHIEMAHFLEGWRSGALPATVAAVHLHAARDALSSLIGAIGTDDILDRVFASFCVGK